MTLPIQNIQAISRNMKWKEMQEILISLNRRKNSIPNKKMYYVHIRHKIYNFQLIFYTYTLKNMQFLRQTHQWKWIWEILIFFWDSCIFTTKITTSRQSAMNRLQLHVIQVYSYMYRTYVCMRSYCGAH